MEYKVGEIVVWCGALGEITSIYKGVVFCDFFEHDGRREMVWFHFDGKYRDYHTEVSFRLATKEQTEEYRKRPKKVAPSMSSHRNLGR